MTEDWLAYIHKKIYRPNRVGLDIIFAKWTYSWKLDTSFNKYLQSVSHKNQVKVIWQVYGILVEKLFKFKV